MGEPNWRHEDPVRRRYSHSLNMLMSQVKNSTTQSLTAPDTVRVHLSFVSVSLSMLHGIGAFCTMLFSLPTILQPCRRFLIFWWISFFWCLFLHELMMDACCMWPARFEKIPLSFVFLSFFCFCFFWTHCTVRSIWLCAVISSFSFLVSSVTKQMKGKSKARLQITKMNTNL